MTILNKGIKEHHLLNSSVCSQIQLNYYPQYPLAPVYCRVEMMSVKQFVPHRQKNKYRQ